MKGSSAFIRKQRRQIFQKSSGKWNGPLMWVTWRRAEDCGLGKPVKWTQVFWQCCNNNTIVLLCCIALFFPLAVWTVYLVLVLLWHIAGRDINHSNRCKHQCSNNANHKYLRIPQISVTNCICNKMFATFEFKQVVKYLWAGKIFPSSKLRGCQVFVRLFQVEKILF